VGGGGSNDQPPLSLETIARARVMGTEEPPRDLASFLTFALGGETFALPLRRAREIVRCDSVTRVPGMPAWMRGVMNVRGSVVPVIDLAPRIGRPPTVLGQRSCALLLDVDWEGETALIAILLQTFGRVFSIRESEVEPPPPFGTRLRADWLQGLVPDGAGFARVLDADRALSPAELLSEAPTAVQDTPKGPA
jgi:purine-binding chemotaxis protein CheW